MLPLQELRTEPEVVHGMAIVLAAEGDVSAVQSDVAVSVAGSRVGVQPRLVTKIRRPSVPDAPRPCVAITPSCRMILRFLAQAAVDPWTPAVEVAAWVAIPAAFGSLLLSPAAAELPLDHLRRIPGTTEWDH